MKLLFKLLNDKAILPTRVHQSDSGLDLYAIEDVQIWARATMKIMLGLAVNIPHGYEGQVRPRSGLSSKGIFAILGTVDAGYLGELAVNVYNSTPETYAIKREDRIAQLVVSSVVTPWCEPDLVNEFYFATERGDKGFGSSGS